MSGHSKWSNIKRTKEKMDAKRGKIFTKIGRELAVIVKQGGADPANNPKLRDAIQKAKQSNMPNDTIARSIKKASGELDTVNYEEITYEGYGVGGSAVIIKCLTDNKNRTAGDMRHCFDKFGGSLGSSGCVSYMFDNRGLIIIEKNDKIDLDELMIDSLEAGALDVIDSDEVVEILTEVNDLNSVKVNLESKYSVSAQEIRMIPQNMVELDEGKLSTFNQMIDKMEDSDDVQEIFHNVEVND